MDRYKICTHNPKDADAARERAERRDQLREKEALAKAALSESSKTIDAATNRMVKLSKKVQDWTERVSRLEEELAFAQKDRDSHVTELAAAQDEVIFQGPIHQAVTDEYDSAKQELALVDQNAIGDQDIQASRDLAIQDVETKIQDSVTRFLETDWLADLLSL